MFVLTHGIVWYTKLQNKENECTRTKISINEGKADITAPQHTTSIAIAIMLKSLRK